MEHCTESIYALHACNLRYYPVKKRDFLRKWHSVLKVPLPVDHFESWIRILERKTRHRVPFYNADIKPEQMFCYTHGIKTGDWFDPHDLKALPEREFPALTILDIEVAGDTPPLCTLWIDRIKYEGMERELLITLLEAFARKDPDVIRMPRAYYYLPYLEQRLLAYGFQSPFHRWDRTPLKYRGGKSFYSYGTVRYQDYRGDLHGRLLVDTSTMIGSSCEVEAVVELCQLSGSCFHLLVSKSFGAVFQAALVREMLRQDLLVAYKEKPLDHAVSMKHLLTSDRVGVTLDPNVGFHTDVAEIDFISMFPWLMYNHNISADMILCDEGPRETAPGIDVVISHARKGLVPLTIKPFIDRRMHYKQNPSAVNKERAVGLKWVLVSSYGYLRFREFKLGMASCHRAIGAYARNVLITIIAMARQRGFEVVHGIVDCLYIKKKGITDKEVKELCDEIFLETGIPISFEGIFKWVMFLPSLLDKDIPVPTRYYGVFRSGTIKMRGIEYRQRSTPACIKRFQKRCIELMGSAVSVDDVYALLPVIGKALRSAVARLPSTPPEELVFRMKVSKTEYTHDLPQKRIIQQLKAQGVEVRAGQDITYIQSLRGPVLPQEYHGRPDVQHYTRLLVRSLYALLEPLGITKASIVEYMRNEYQEKLTVYIPPLLVKYARSFPAMEESRLEL